VSYHVFLCHHIHQEHVWNEQHKWGLVYFVLAWHLSHLQSKLLRKAESLLVKEKEQKDLERENTLREKAPPLKLSGLSIQELQVQNLTVSDIYIESFYCGQMTVSQISLNNGVHGVYISHLSLWIIICLCRSFVEICTRRLTSWMKCDMTLT